MLVILSVVLVDVWVVAVELVVVMVLVLVLVKVVLPWTHKWDVTKLMSDGIKPIKKNDDEIDVVFITKKHETQL